jgi:hypothetical protein
MSRESTCPRLFEAEAMRDGRLEGAERASYERHVVTCAACAREVRALERLAASLRASGLDEVDELRIRREKTRLLGALDRTLVAPEHRGTRGRRLIGVASVAAAAVCVLVIWRARSPASAARASSAVVHADGVAVWSERRDGDREEVRLERGALWIHVGHAPGDGRLVVVLPDGELEDIGTTFTVSAENGRTKRVTVEEGHVLLRLRDRSVLTIGSGETWVADVPAPVACATVAPSSEPPASAPPRSSAVPVGSATAPDLSVEFRAAMSALDVGDDCEAATRFGSFLQRHPGAPRAEDAAYLRVITLQRCGDAEATREAAMTYLRLYPAGFRRAEVEPLAR